MTTSRPDQLDCVTARERLDAVWLDPLPDEPLDVELSAAWDHVQECSACWEALRQHGDADQKIAEAMSAVSVPGHLKERLLAQAATLSCAAGDDDVELSAPSPMRADALRRPNLSRRRVWTITTAAAMLVCAASGAWLWTVLSIQPVTLQTLRDQTPLDSLELPLVTNAAQAPVLPDAWVRAKGLKMESPRWFTPPNSKVSAAWFSFELRLVKQPSVRGVLLAALQSQVLNPPPALVIGPTHLGYTTRDGKPVSVVGWSERGVVYVCFVPGDPKLLERLLRVTTPTAA